MLSPKTTVNLSNGTKIPLVGLGVWQIPVGEPTEQAVSWALEAGYKHIDTAKFYKNEASVGAAIRKSRQPRESIWVTTKLWPLDSPEKAFEASLGRLDLDYVDLYLVHWPLPGFEKKTWRAMEKIYESGKCKAIGVSNFSVNQLKRILSIANVPPAVNQIKCSPYNYDKTMHQFCIDNGVALEAYSPLTRGSHLNDSLLIELSEKYKKSAAQILIRWAVQKNIVVIPKSQNKERIAQNIDVFDYSISEEDINKLDQLSQ